MSLIISAVRKLTDVELQINRQQCRRNNVTSHTLLPLWQIQGVISGTEKKKQPVLMCVRGFLNDY